MKKKYNVYIDIYDVSVEVILVKNVSEMHKTMMRNGYEGGMEEKWLATTIAAENKKVLVTILKDKFSPGMLAHELYHAVEDYITPTYNLEGEAKAYLIDFLVEKYSKFFLKEIEIWIDKTKNSK